MILLDSDDWLEPACCETVIHKIQKEDADIVFFEYYKEYKDRTVRKFPKEQEALSFCVYKKNRVQRKKIWDLC